MGDDGPVSEPLQVDVWSDVQCPWCYIGKRKFERGVDLYGGAVAVTYHSFELAPDSPVDVDITHLDYLSAKFGMDSAQVRAMLDRVTGIAAEVGLPYDFDSVQQTNTRTAHELLHLAKDHGVQEPMKERLMRAYFTEGRHIGHVDDLVALAAEVGLDPAETRAALADGRYAAAVDADVEQARAYGITGVPFYVIDGRYGVSGAQPPEAFAQALAQAAADPPAG